MSNPYYGQGQAQGYVYEPGNPQPRYDPDYANPAYAPSPDLSTARRFDQDPRTRRDHRRRSSSHYNNNNNDEDNSSTESSSDDNEHRPHRHRRSSSKNKPRAYHKDPSSRSKSSNRLDKAREHFSTSDRGVGAGMIGAVAGAVLAQETAQRNGKGSIGATIAGLVLGGLAGNALEKGFDRKQEERKAATEKYDRRRDR
ncbi:hypothetical protein BDR22DRAFT_892225 [Usnea florida]